MPVYDYLCPFCGHKEDKYMKHFEDKLYQVCGKCGRSTDPIPSLTAINPDWEPYYDSVMEEHIRSRSHRRELMKKHGLIEKNKTITRFSDKNKWI